jgi:hypothetical protein
VAVQVCVTVVEIDYTQTTTLYDSHSNWADNLEEAVDVMGECRCRFSVVNEVQILAFAQETAYHIEQAMVVEQEIPELDGEERHHLA